MVERLTVNSSVVGSHSEKLIITKVTKVTGLIPTQGKEINNIFISSLEERGEVPR